jgi:NodT family efflux transporter outer membrane factor (OMF) lipoprotein
MTAPRLLALAATLLSAGTLAAGCAVGPNYRRPPLSPTASYGSLAMSPRQAPGAPQLVSGQDIPAQWWQVYHCAELDALVAQALANSPTLEAAKAALRAAREQVKAQKGAFFPQVVGSFQPGHQEFARALSPQTASGDSIYNLTTTQVAVTYAPDVFGGNHRQVETLAAQAEQQRFELEAARLTLASNVVVAAIQDAQYRAQINETKAIIAGQRETLASFERQAQLGQVSQADLAAQRALLAQAEATLPSLEKQYRINRDQLAALLGRSPGEGPTVAFSFAAFALPDQLPLSLPGRLVDQRPDVRIAEEQLHAASAQVGVAIANRLPNIQIEAIAGSATLSLVPTFDTASNFWNLTGTLTQPIFEGGTLLHRQKAAEAAYDQAAAQYRQAVVAAFQNTADVLHALWTDADAQASAETAARAAHDSLEIARKQLDLGDLSRLAEITAEQTDAQARLTLLQAKANRYADVAALFQALGGGWWNAPLEPRTGDAGTGASSPAAKTAGS